MTGRTKILNASISNVLAMTGGWLAYNSGPLLRIPEAINGDWAHIYLSPVQLAMAGIILLVIAWRMSIHSRLFAWFTLFAWHIGAGSAIPSGWAQFFGNDFGWIAWVIWAAIASTPALFFPTKFAPYALAAGSVMTALTPIGMMNPLLASTVFWPAGGWLAIALAIGILILPSIKSEKAFVLIGIIIIAFGIFMNARYDAKDRRPPATTHAITTYEGRHSNLAINWFGRQGRISRQAKDDIESGAKLVVTPEGTVDKWDVWAAAVWRHAKSAAAEKGSMLLVGVYVEQNGRWQDGLLDIVNNKLYSASVPMPISMWNPFGKEHYPLALENLPKLIETPVGKAAYIICYEEMLIWPLAVKAGFSSPDFIISAANQWFTTGESGTAESQKRSFDFQTRLWGLPAIRAVNW